MCPVCWLCPACFDMPAAQTVASPPGWRARLCCAALPPAASVRMQARRRARWWAALASRPGAVRRGVLRLPPPNPPAATPGTRPCGWRWQPERRPLTPGGCAARPPQLAAQCSGNAVPCSALQAGCTWPLPTRHISTGVTKWCRGCWAMFAGNESRACAPASEEGSSMCAVSPSRAPRPPSATQASRGIGGKNSRCASS